MKSYAVARLVEVQLNEDIASYLQRIDATLRPFGGRFIIHGGAYERLEGNWQGDLVVIEFPDRQRALDWYWSPAYQAIVNLRIDNSKSETLIVDGVPAGHKATDILSPDAGTSTGIPPA